MFVLAGAWFVWGALEYGRSGSRKKTMGDHTVLTPRFQEIDANVRLLAESGSREMNYYLMGPRENPFNVYWLTPEGDELAYSFAIFQRYPIGLTPVRMAIYDPPFNYGVPYDTGGTLKFTEPALLGADRPPKWRNSRLAARGESHSARNSTPSQPDPGLTGETDRKRTTGNDSGKQNGTGTTHEDPGPGPGVKRTPGPRYIGSWWTRDRRFAVLRGAEDGGLLQLREGDRLGPSSGRVLRVGRDGVMILTPDGATWFRRRAAE